VWDLNRKTALPCAATPFIAGIGDLHRFSRLAKLLFSKE
jgi:hypothetical protein